MTSWDQFTKNRIRAGVPRRVEGNTWSLHTGASGSTTTVKNDDGTYPYVRTINVGNLAIDETVSVTAETYQASLIVDDEPSVTAQWWFSKDDGTTMERVKIIKRDPGFQGFYYKIIFQLQG